jgi:hypothetical protein
MDTIRYIKNNIFSHTREDGSVAVEHHEKTELLWHSFKQRLGVPFPISPTFDFTQFFTPLESSDDLSRPFTQNEIDQIVAHI